MRRLTTITLALTLVFGALFSVQSLSVVQSTNVLTGPTHEKGLHFFDTDMPLFFALALYCYKETDINRIAEKILKINVQEGIRELESINKGFDTNDPNKPCDSFGGGMYLKSMSGVLSQEPERLVSIVEVYMVTKIVVLTVENGFAAGQETVNIPITEHVYAIKVQGTTWREIKDLEELLTINKEFLRRLNLRKKKEETEL